MQGLFSGLIFYYLGLLNNILLEVRYIIDLILKYNILSWTYFCSNRYYKSFIYFLIIYVILILDTRSIMASLIEQQHTINFEIKSPLQSLIKHCIRHNRCTYRLLPSQYVWGRSAIVRDVYRATGNTKTITYCTEMRLKALKDRTKQKILIVFFN